MRNLFFILYFAALFPITIFAEKSESRDLDKVENRVDALFKSLRKVSDKNAEQNTVSNIKYDFEGYFKSADQNCPNEFKNIWPQNSVATTFETDIRPARYFDLFLQIFRASEFENCTFDFTPLNSCIVREPEYTKNEASPTLAQVVIRKVYLRDKAPIAAFNDTLVIGLKEMKIHAWANEASTHSIGYFGGDVLDVEQLKVTAALAYNRKQYTEAYQIYQQIVNKYPEEGDPYYRMAIMLYKKDYGKNMKKRERHGLILEYLNKAIRYGSLSTRECAENMKYWLTC